MTMDLDRFGNPVDVSVGYARGRILGGAHDELRRNARAREIMRRRVAVHGPDSLFSFNGSPCAFPLGPEDLGPLTQEPLGNALLAPRLRELALAHTGGGPDAEATVLNRTAGCLVAAILAFAGQGDAVVSVAPGSGSHPCVRRGAVLAGARLLEVATIPDLAQALERGTGRLVVVTGVTSEQDVLPEHDFLQAITLARRSGRICVVDDAYGARVRTVLFGQPAALAAGAHLAVTSMQKAGLEGPRAGLLVGDADKVRAVATMASEMGQEGRAPMAAAVVRALEAFEPAHLHEAVETGRALHQRLVDAFGPERVRFKVLGPVISEEDVLEMALERSAPGPTAATAMVPAEVTAALGMLLLEGHGVVTANVTASPGARVSLRLKTTPAEVARMGGPPALVAALVDALDGVAQVVHDEAAMRRLVVGGGDG